MERFVVDITREEGRCVARTSDVPGLTGTGATSVEARDDLRSAWQELQGEVQVEAEFCLQEEPGDDTTGFSACAAGAEVTNAILEGERETNGGVSVPEPQRFLKALLAGFVAALICASLWCTIALHAEVIPRFIVLFIGVAIGITIRVTGNGTMTRFRILAAFLAMFCCLYGNIWSLAIAIAWERDASPVLFAALASVSPKFFLAVLQELTEVGATRYVLMCAVVAYLIGATGRKPSR